MASKIISILGCGWLGLPLGISLMEDGYRVKGSCTSLKKMGVLKDAGLEPFLITCQPEITGDDVEEFFKADVLVLTIPFKRDLVEPYLYQTQIDSVIRCVEQSPIHFLIFTSSTSIYPETNREISEDDFFDPPDTRAEVLFEIERSLMTGHHFFSTIVRFAGLYGYDRKPGRFWAGRKNIGSANSRVNFIHRDDAVSIFREIIRQDVRGEIFNGCSDRHPTKREFYTKAAEKLGLPVPLFDETAKAEYKIVNNERVKERLNYYFKYPDPLRGLTGAP